MTTTASSCPRRRSPSSVGGPSPRSAVTVHVSKGPDVVAVPNLSNLTREAATQAVAKQGLKLKVSGKYRAGDLVESQTPCPAQKVARGSTVTVTFSANGNIFGILLCG